MNVNATVQQCIKKEMKLADWPPLSSTCLLLQVEVLSLTAFRWLDWKKQKRVQPHYGKFLLRLKAMTEVAGGGR
jgi:hypothetical protein